MDRRRTSAALLALAACIACATAAPTSDQTALETYEAKSSDCYYNFQHYGEGDRIMTNEPCLNCTCHNRMLMCYLRVCPFTKPIGLDCTVEKRADQCCPIVTCPDVPVDLLTSTSTTSPAEYGSTGLGRLDKYGCDINGKYFPEGAKVPPSPNKPCEHCYCIRNMTTCVMQECTLHVDGCTPIYHKDVCCPVRYSCDHPEDEIPLLDEMTTTVRPTPGFLLTTTTPSPVTQVTQDCIHADEIVPDGALIKTEKACEHCYCMKGDIVCVVQECGTPMENEGKNCTSMAPRHGQCCPDTYICEGDEPEEFSTSVLELTTAPPRRSGTEGSGYRNEPDEPHTGLPTIIPDIEGSGDDLVTLLDITETPNKDSSFLPEVMITSTEKVEITSESVDKNKVDMITSDGINPEETGYSTDPSILSEATDDPNFSHSSELLTTTADHSYDSSSPSFSTELSKDNEATSKPIEVIGENDVVKAETTTSSNIITDTTNKQDNLMTKIDDFGETETKYSTQGLEEITNTVETQETTTTSTSISDISGSIEMHKPDEKQTTSTLDLSDSYTTTKEVQYMTETTSVNPSENEIDEDSYSHTFSPGRIPGEGDCLLNGNTYKNYSDVPSTNNCHTGCKCVSSIIKCDPIICSAPPEYMNGCEPIYDSPDSCCPTYVCNTKETLPPQSHNQMSGIDTNRTVAASECSSKDCVPSIEKELTANTVHCSGSHCASSEQLCDNEQGCLETSVNKCDGENCGINQDTTKTPEISSQDVISTDCKDENLCKKPTESNTQGECTDATCKTNNIPSVCTGPDCTKPVENAPSDSSTSVPLSPEYSTATSKPSKEEPIQSSNKPTETIEIKTEINNTEEPVYINKEANLMITTELTPTDILTTKGDLTTDNYIKQDGSAESTTQSSLSFETSPSNTELLNIDRTTSHENQETVTIVTDNRRKEPSLPITTEIEHMYTESPKETTASVNEPEKSISEQTANTVAQYDISTKSTITDVSIDEQPTVQFQDAFTIKQNIETSTAISENIVTTQENSNLITESNQLYTKTPESANPIDVVTDKNYEDSSTYVHMPTATISYETTSKYTDDYSVNYQPTHEQDPNTITTDASEPEAINKLTTENVDLPVSEANKVSLEPHTDDLIENDNIYLPVEKVTKDDDQYTKIDVIDSTTYKYTKLPENDYTENEKVTLPPTAIQPNDEHHEVTMVDKEKNDTEDPAISNTTPAKDIDTTKVSINQNEGVPEAPTVQIQETDIPSTTARITQHDESYPKQTTVSTEAEVYTDTPQKYTITDDDELTSKPTETEIFTPDTHPSVVMTSENDRMSTTFNKEETTTPILTKDTENDVMTVHTETESPEIYTNKPHPEVTEIKIPGQDDVTESQDKNDYTETTMLETTGVKEETVTNQIYLDNKIDTTITPVSKLVTQTDTPDSNQEIFVTEEIYTKSPHKDIELPIVIVKEDEPDTNVGLDFKEESTTIQNNDLNATKKTDPVAFTTESVSSKKDESYLDNALTTASSLETESAEMDKHIITEASTNKFDDTFVPTVPTDTTLAPVAIENQNQISESHFESEKEEVPTTILVDDDISTKATLTDTDASNNEPYNTDIIVTEPPYKFTIYDKDGVTETIIMQLNENDQKLYPKPHHDDNGEYDKTTDSGLSEINKPDIENEVLHIDPHHDDKEMSTGTENPITHETEIATESENTDSATIILDGEPVYKTTVAQSTTEKQLISENIENNKLYPTVLVEQVTKGIQEGNNELVTESSSGTTIYEPQTLDDNNKQSVTTSATIEDNSSTDVPMTTNSQQIETLSETTTRKQNDEDLQPSVTFIPIQPTAYDIVKQEDESKTTVQEQYFTASQPSESVENTVQEQFTPNVMKEETSMEVTEKIQTSTLKETSELNNVKNEGVTSPDKPSDKEEEITMTTQYSLSDTVDTRRQYTSSKPLIETTTDEKEYTMLETGTELPKDQNKLTTTEVKPSKEETDLTTEKEITLVFTDVPETDLKETQQFHKPDNTDEMSKTEIPVNDSKFSTFEPDLSEGVKSTANEEVTVPNIVTPETSSKESQHLPGSDDGHEKPATESGMTEPSDENRLSTIPTKEVESAANEEITQANTATPETSLKESQTLPEQTPEKSSENLKPDSVTEPITESLPKITISSDLESVPEISTNMADRDNEMVTEKGTETYEGAPEGTEKYNVYTDESLKPYTTKKDNIETTTLNILDTNSESSTDKSKTKLDTLNEITPETSIPDIYEASTSPDITHISSDHTDDGVGVSIASEAPATSYAELENEIHPVNEKQHTQEKPITTTEPQVMSEQEPVKEYNENITNKPDSLDDKTTILSMVTEKVSEGQGDKIPSISPTTENINVELASTTLKYEPSPSSEVFSQSTESQPQYSETTPDLIELEEHTHQTDEYVTSKITTDDEITTTQYLPQEPERSSQPTVDATKYPEENLTDDTQKLAPQSGEQPAPITSQTTPKEEVPLTEAPYVVQQGQTSTDQVTEIADGQVILSSTTPETSKFVSDTSENISSPIPDVVITTEKTILSEIAKPEILNTETLEEEPILDMSKSTTVKTIEEITTQPSKVPKPDEKPVDLPSETPKPDYNEPPAEDISPDFPPSGSAGYGQEDQTDYVEEDQAFGPGTCRYGGKVYVSAQQIPRDDPCDFCFCFRSDIICLQQSCPPPIHGCHEEPIQGFCCPRYECPVSMATALNVTTTTTTTTTTLPPHFLPHAYKGAAQRRGCQIKGHTYKVGEVVRASSGPCLHCTCGGDGQMKCDPKVCTPEPMLRQMIAAAVSSERRR